MTRFFVDSGQISGSEVRLGADDAHHLRVVLHADVGERIAVLDGLGREYTATLTSLSKNRASAKITAVFSPETEPRTRITVVQALPKMAEKMEQVLQRCTEIGAASFVVFAAEKGLPHLTGERQEKRTVRWAEIVKTAAEQAHRAVMPTIQYAGSLEEAIGRVNGMVLLAHTGSDAELLKGVIEAAAVPFGQVAVVIGPESGLSSDEVKVARSTNSRLVSLGPRVLRTETAAMVMTAQLIYALG